MEEKIYRPVIRYFDEITEGMSAKVSKIISEKDVISFAEVTGDNNPIHLDFDYAADAIFGQRVVHGMLVAGCISAVFGCNFPGVGWIYVNQSLQFKKPVFIDEEIKIAVKVRKLIHKKQMVEFNITTKVEEKTVITGEATLMSPRRSS
jgi:3-hydroxybutyryl-CoA dehydratase